MVEAQRTRSAGEKTPPATEPTGNVIAKPRRLEQVKIRLIDNLMLEGTLHMREHFRLSDTMNDANIQFLPLTQVKVCDAQGRLLEELEFVSVNRSQIKFICGQDDVSESAADASE